MKTSAARNSRMRPEDCRTKRPSADGSGRGAASCSLMRTSCRSGRGDDVTFRQGVGGLHPCLDCVHGLGHPLDDERELVFRARERRREKGLIAGIPVDRRLGRVDDEAATKRLVVDPPRDAEGRVEEGSTVPWVDVVDPKEEAPSPHLADDVAVSERLLELRAALRTAFRDTLDEPVLLQVTEDGEPDGARKRRSVPGMPELERPRARRNGIVDLLPAEDP